MNILRSQLFQNLPCFRLIVCKRYSSSYYHCPSSLPLVYRTIGQQLQLSAQKYPNREAITSHHENKTLTFPESLDKADKLAAGLMNLGMKKGDFIGLWMPNKLNWYTAMLAIARLGGVCVALNPAYQTPEVEYCIKKVGIKAMIITETFKTQNYYKMLAEICPEMQSGGMKIENKNYTLERVIIDSDKRISGALSLDEISKVSESEVNKVAKLQDEIEPDNGCNIQFTSGTTGKPKAALLSHFNIINDSTNIGYRLGYDKAVHKICFNVPLFHVFGLAIGLVCTLVHGNTIFLPSLSFNPEESVNCIRKHNCSYVYGTPTMHVDVVSHIKKTNQKLDSLEYAVTGGAPVAPQLLLDMEKYMGIKRVRSVYGLTETTAVVFQSIIDEPKDKVLDFVGKVQDNVEAKVIDKKGKTVPFGIPGELCIRGYVNMLGYYGDEEKTQDILGADHWLKTGDQFILYEDGYGKIVGRLKEMIIRGGENIFPKEVEDFLSTHPDIEEVHVAGIPDERMGEEVAAFIKMVSGKNELTQEEIKSFSKGKISHFKVPRYVEIVNEFPKTTSGKIQKFMLVQEFKEKLN